MAEFSVSGLNRWQPNLLTIYFAIGFQTLFTDEILGFRLSDIDAECLDPSCLSYYYPGGIRRIRPLPIILKNITGDVVSVNGNVGVQVDFWDFDEVDAGFNLEDCTTLGGDEFALLLCVRNSQSNSSNLVAGSS